MRSVLFSLAAIAALVSTPIHAADLPTQAQIQSAVDQRIKLFNAKNPGSAKLPTTVFGVVSCKPSLEVKDEVACLIGTRTSQQEAYTVIPLRQQGSTWVDTDRANAAFPSPTAAEAQAAMRKMAQDSLDKDPKAANDPQIKEALTTITVKAVANCRLQPKTGYLACGITLGLQDKQDAQTEWKLAVDGDAWRFVSR